MNDDSRFSFERLDAYCIAREALGIGWKSRARWKGLPGDLASQFERAMVSVVLNIAEGAGRESQPDRKRCFAIARGSANEAGSAVEVAAACGAITVEEHAALRSRLLRVAWMLTGLIKR